jgi:HEAT repeat protein
VDELDFTPTQAVRLVDYAIRHTDDAACGVALSAALQCRADPSGVIADAIAAVPDKSPWLLFALIRRFGHLDVVLRVLNDRRAVVRRIAVEALEFVQDSRVLAPARDCLHDDDASVRSAAGKTVAALQQQRDGIDRRIEFQSVRKTKALAALILGEAPEIAGLVELVNGPASIPETIKPQLRSLAAQRFRADLDGFIAALPEGQGQLSIEMIRVLGDIGDHRLISFVAVQYHSGAGQNVEEAIADAFGAIGGFQATDFLAQMIDLGAGPRTVQVLKTMGPMAGFTLVTKYTRPGHIRSKHAKLLAECAGEKALDALTEALSDDSRDVRDGAQSALATLGSLAVEPLLNIAESGTPLARSHAIAALASIGDMRAFDLVLGLAETGSDIGRAAIAALGSFPTAASLGKLAVFVLANDERARLSAISALGGIADPRAIPLIEIAASDDRRSMRAAAAAAAGRVVARTSHSAAVRLLLRLAVDADPLVARAAAAELAILPNRDALIADTLKGTDHSAITKRIREAEAANRQGLRLRVTRGGRALYALAPELPPLAADASGVLGLGESKSATAKPQPVDRPAEPVLTDAVFFSSIAPARVAAGESFVLDLWAHREELKLSVVEAARLARTRDVRVATKGPVEIDRLTTILIRLSVPDLRIPQLEDAIRWTGTTGNASFPITVPPDVSAGVHLGSFSIFVGPLLVSRLHFELCIVDDARSATTALVDATVGETRVRSAFASYAAEDREDVLSRLQGILKVLPDLDVFLDVLSLRSGDDWQSRIREEIKARDVFYLFWSLAASRSKWVDFEWRTALAERGRDYIDPVPLEPPRFAPPPTELAGLHFSDWTLTFGQGT